MDVEVLSMFLWISKFELKNFEVLVIFLWMSIVKVIIENGVVNFEFVYNLIEDGDKILNRNKEWFEESFLKRMLLNGVYIDIRILE